MNFHDLFSIEWSYLCTRRHAYCISNVILYEMLQWSSTLWKELWKKTLASELVPEIFFDSINILSQSSYFDIKATEDDEEG